jgi:hypothetical protein
VLLKEVKRARRRCFNAMVSGRIGKGRSFARLPAVEGILLNLVDDLAPVRNRTRAQSGPEPMMENRERNRIPKSEHDRLYRD